MRLTHTHAIRVIDATSEVVDNPLVLKLARGMGCGSASMTALRFLFRIILITVAFAMMLAGGLFIAMSTIQLADVCLANSRSRKIRASATTPFSPIGRLPGLTWPRLSHGDQRSPQPGRVSLCRRNPDGTF